MFDLSLVAMGVEILLELCNTIMVERRKWVVYGSVTAGNTKQILLQPCYCYSNCRPCQF